MFPLKNLARKGLKDWNQLYTTWYTHHESLWSFDTLPPICGNGVSLQGRALQAICCEDRLPSNLKHFPSCLKSNSMLASSDPDYKKDMITSW